MARIMSSAADVTAVLHLLEAYNAGDLDALERSLDPEVEWHSASAYRGPKAVRAYFETFRARWSKPRARPDDFRAAAGRLLMVVCFYEGEPGDARPADQRQSWVTEFAGDGRFRRVVAYPSPAEAARALEALTEAVHV